MNRKSKGTGDDEISSETVRASRLCECLDLGTGSSKGQDLSCL
jgi:hypothetical protein